MALASMAGGRPLRKSGLGGDGLAGAIGMDCGAIRRCLRAP